MEHKLVVAERVGFNHYIYRNCKENAGIVDLIEDFHVLKLGHLGPSGSISAFLLVTLVTLVTPPVTLVFFALVTRIGHTFTVILICQ